MMVLVGGSSIKEEALKAFRLLAVEQFAPLVE